MVPHSVFLEEVPSVLDGAADREQDGPPHAHLSVLLPDVPRLTRGKNLIFTTLTFFPENRHLWLLWLWVSWIALTSPDIFCDKSRCIGRIVPLILVSEFWEERTGHRDVIWLERILISLKKQKWNFSCNLFRYVREKKRGNESWTPPSILNMSQVWHRLSRVILEFNIKSD